MVIWGRLSDFKSNHFLFINAQLKEGICKLKSKIAIWHLFALHKYQTVKV